MNVTMDAATALRLFRAAEHLASLPVETPPPGILPMAWRMAVEDAAEAVKLAKGGKA